MNRSTLVAGALVLAAAGPLAGQAVTRLTIDEAVDLGRQSNPSLARARQGIRSAEAGLLSGYGAFLPSLNASASWSGNRQTTVTGSDDFGQTISLPNAITFRSSSAQQGISSSVTLFDGFQNVHNLNAARFDVKAAEAAVDGQSVAVDAEVRRRFYGAVRAGKLIAVEQGLLEAARERLDANERLFRVAAADQVDVLGAQVDLAQAQQSLDQAIGNAHKARLAVLQQIGILDRTLDFEVVGDFPGLFDPSSLDPDQLVLQGLELSPAVTQRDAEMVAASRRVGAARGNRLPSVTFGASFSRSLSGPDYGAFLDVNPRNRNLGFNLQVQLPLFQGFTIGEQVTRANASYLQAEEDRRAAALQVEQAVRSALIDLQNAYDGLNTQRRSTDLSRRRVELAREQYRISALNFTSLQQIIQQATNDERSLVQAEHDFAVAVVGLDEQIGGQTDVAGR